MKKTKYDYTGLWVGDYLLLSDNQSGRLAWVERSNVGRLLCVRMMQSSTVEVTGGKNVYIRYISDATDMGEIVASAALKKLEEKVIRDRMHVSMADRNKRVFSEWKGLT